MKNTTGSCRRASDRLVTANASSRLRTVVLSAPLDVAATGLSWAQANSGASPTQAASACAAHGGWTAVKKGQPADQVSSLHDLQGKTSRVLLGESHYVRDPNR